MIDKEEVRNVFADGLKRVLREDAEALREAERAELKVYYTARSAGRQKVERKLAAANEKRDAAESALAIATDLANSWAREVHVEEAENEAGLKGVIDRLGFQCNRLRAELSKANIDAANETARANDAVRKLAAADRLIRHAADTLDTYADECDHSVGICECPERRLRLGLRDWLAGNRRAREAQGGEP
jgi:hypothetical protein